MTRSIRSFTVPIDDRWHPLRLAGDIVHVGRPPSSDRTGNEERYVELWALHDDVLTPDPRYFRVVSTGDPIGPTASYVGTAFGVAGRAVWHLLEHDTAIVGRPS